MINKEKRILGRWIVLANIPDESREEIVNDCKSLQKIERDSPNTAQERRKVIGKEKFEEIMEIFSYEIDTEKLKLIWSKKF